MSARCIKVCDVVDQAKIKTQVAARAVSPGVSGAIDCIHVKALSKVDCDFVKREDYGS